MRDIRSKNDYEEQEKELANETDEHLEDEREECRQIEEINRVLMDLNQTFLLECAEAMNQMADETRTKGTERIQELHKEVEEGVDVEKQEVSDPSEEKEKSEKFDAGFLEAESRTVDRYDESLLEAMRTKDEAGDFFNELAEKSQEHQETDRREAKTTAEDARNALNTFRKF